MTTTARVEKWKRPYGRVSQWDAYVLAEDEWGVWLHSPKGSPHHLLRHGPWVVPYDGVQLIPAGRPWWVAWFWDDPTGRWAAADVCTPAAADIGSWKYVDLELDVVGNEGGFLQIVDEDEFDEAIGAGHISEIEAAKARAAAAEVRAAMSSRQEPFGPAGWAMLDDAVARALPPTT